MEKGKEGNSTVGLLINKLALKFCPTSLGICALTLVTDRGDYDR